MAARYKNPYASENELCREFTEHAKKRGWLVFPETSNQDLLLVATDKVECVGVSAGYQVGVQAKLQDNLAVLAQSIPSRLAVKGPHYHAVLVPRAKPEFKKVAHRLGLHVFSGVSKSKGQWVKSFRGELRVLPRNHVMFYTEPLWHPEVEIWTPPGVNSPKSISPWKVDAVKICLHGKKRGYLTSADFKEHGIHMSRWVKSRWIVDTGQRIGRLKKYVLGESPPHVKWPEIAEALSAVPS